MLVQEMKRQDFGRRTTFAETMLQMFEEDPELVILTSDEAHFHLNGTNKTFVTSRRSTLGRCTNIRYIVIGLRFGLRWLSWE